MANFIQWQNSSGIYVGDPPTARISPQSTYRFYMTSNYTGNHRFDIQLINQYGTPIKAYTVISSQYLSSSGGYSTYFVLQTYPEMGWTSGGTKIRGQLYYGTTLLANTSNYDLLFPTATAPSFNTYQTTYADTLDITMSWTASTISTGSIIGYILERKINSGSWTQIYNGTNRTFIDTEVKTTWNTVAYRVLAKSSFGLNSSYTTSSAITIAHSTNSIYIKKSGIWTNGIPYVKKSGVWTEVAGAYKKINGVWTINS
jgi:hypothetical protein